MDAMLSTLAGITKYFDIFAVLLSTKILFFSLVCSCLLPICLSLLTSLFLSFFCCQESSRNEDDTFVSVLFFSR